MHRLTPTEAAWLAWRVDGELHGHSVQQVLGFVSEMGDLEDADRSLWAHPAPISPTPSPGLIAWLRRRRRL